MLELIRREGYLALAKSRVFRVAAPVFDRLGAVDCAIVLAKPFNEVIGGSAWECIDLVRQVARELSSGPMPASNA